MVKVTLKQNRKRPSNFAETGFSGPARPLPYRPALTRAFGRNLSDISAYTGPQAAAACRVLGARAFTIGNRIAFGETPDLRTTAHETAHVLQQTGGVRKKDIIGKAGDRFERQADRAADQVSRGGIVSVLSSGQAPGIQLDRNRRQNSSFNSDWAGEEILYRWLSGGGDWNLTYNSHWSNYMEANETLRTTLALKLFRYAQEQVAAEGNVCVLPEFSSFDMQQFYGTQFHTAIENGEGVIGYQYLHGTNANAGDFQITGPYVMERTECGNWRFTFDFDYTWNDIIDPNRKYSSDTAKSLFGQVISLGQATDYSLSITWSERSVLELSEDGSRIVSSSGYPFDIVTAISRERRSDRVIRTVVTTVSGYPMREEGESDRVYQQRVRSYNLWHLKGGMCWVARVIVPEQWLDVRHYIVNTSPEWFRNAYATFGEAYAEFLRGNTALIEELLPSFLKMAKWGRNEEKPRYEPEILLPVYDELLRFSELRSSERVSQ